MKRKMKVPAPARGVWKMNPVQRVKESKKVYNRKRAPRTFY